MKKKNKRDVHNLCSTDEPNQRLQEHFFNQTHEKKRYIEHSVGLIDHHGPFLFLVMFYGFLTHSAHLFIIIIQFILHAIGYMS